MIQLNLGSREARIWLQELPDADYEAHEVVEHLLTAKTSALSEIRQAAVELFRHTTGPSSYGLLGAEFTPKPTGYLVVSVAVSSTDGRRLEWAFANAIDEVYVGLLPEYISGILEGVHDAGEILGSGVLRFQWAAHGAVGSSQRFFEELARIVVQLLTDEANSLSEEELVELVSFRMSS